MSVTARRVMYVIWGLALAALVALSVRLGETTLTPALQTRLERRSAKANIARDALAQREASRTLAFSPPGGYYDEDIRVEMRPGTPAGVPGAKVVFTTDGSVPTYTVGTLYQHPFHLGGDQQPSVVVLRAREVSEDGQWGPVVSASYVMGVPARLPVLSLIIDPAELADLEAHELARGADWERSIHLSYITSDHQLAFATPAGLRIRSEIEGLPKKSFWLYFRQEYGQARLDYPLFEGDGHSFKRLVLDAGSVRSGLDRSLRWTLLENQITADLMQELGGVAPRGQFVVLFLNGQPWGVYNLRERPDRFFLQDHYNIQDADLIENRQAQEGDVARWEALLDFVETHSLAEAENFAFVQTQVDVQNFTDYVLLHMYVASDDWPQHNAVRARPREPGGRWFWIAWEASRGYGATGDLEFKAVDWATRSYALDPHEGGTWLRSTLLLRRLLDNDEYRATFVSRAADLLNTVLSARSVDARVTLGMSALSSDVRYEENRWPGPLDWRSNGLALRAWVRARPERMRQELMGKFNLTGTLTLEFMPPATGQGYVVVNGWPLRDLPWQGVYFAGSQIRVTAVPTPGYVFAGWDALDLPSTPAITLTASAPRSLSPRFAPAPAGALLPNDAILNEFWINDDGTPYASLEGRPLEGDWVEILVVQDGLDMRGWRVTDNDTKTATDEGSLILPSTAAFAALPRGTVILLLATDNESNALNFPRDDLDASDGRLVLYVGNGALDAATDPGFGLGRSNDNLVLLAPGPTSSFADDVAIDFVAEGANVTPAAFGALVDGVVFEHPFRGLSADNGCVFGRNRLPGRAPFDNDDGDDPLTGDDQPGLGGWLLDLHRAYAGDDVMPGAQNLLTPGGLNPGQARP
ncbi:MAG: CotH kinase family protein [Thermoflexales bacterium]|nr:CotH kinase family protein [Thermoflexales bacterium]